MGGDHGHHGDHMTTFGDVTASIVQPPCNPNDPPTTLRRFPEFSQIAMVAVGSPFGVMGVLLKQFDVAIGQFLKKKDPKKEFYCNLYNIQYNDLNISDLDIVQE